jgi:glycosyltransferase involved in cell wall biosynthesis
MHIPKVSIGLPVHNGEKFLNQAIESLLAQTFTDFELIISDNASTDSTETICRKYVLKDLRIRYVRQRENIGPTANFEIVRSQAAGEYFMWHAADDLCEPSCLKVLTEVLDQNPRVVLAICDVRNVSQDGEMLFTSYLDNIRLADVADRWLTIRYLFFRNPTSNVFFAIYGLFRTRVVRMASLNYRNLVTYLAGSEIPFLAQMALLGQIVSVPGELKIYRRHSESIFHQESRRISTLDRLKNFFGISRCLMQIALSSETCPRFKLKCGFFILRDCSQFTLVFIARKLLPRKLFESHTIPQSDPAIDS